LFFFLLLNIDTIAYAHSFGVINFFAKIYLTAYAEHKFFFLLFFIFFFISSAPMKMIMIMMMMSSGRRMTY